MTLWKTRGGMLLYVTEQEEADLPAQMEAKLSEVLAGAGRSGKPGGKKVSNMLSHFSKVKNGLNVTEEDHQQQKCAV